MLNNLLLQEVFFDSLCCFPLLGKDLKIFLLRVLKFIFIKLFNKYLLSTRSCVGSKDAKKQGTIPAFQEKIRFPQI